MTVRALQATLRLLAREPQTQAPSAESSRNRLTYDAYNVALAIHDENTDPANGLKLDVPMIDESTNVSRTVDFTAARLARDPSQTVDLTGKVLVAGIVQAASGNANVVSVVTALSNPYGKFTVDLSPGERIAMLAEKSSAIGLVPVSPTAKDLDLTVTGGDQINVFLVFASTS